MADEQEQLQKKRSWISRLVANPVYLILTGIATFVGIPLSIYLFYAGRAVPNLTYYVSQTRTSIVTSQADQKLSVSYAGRPVHGDISSAQITIWNAGTKAITHSDLLTPITLTFTSQNPILDAKVLQVSRQLIDFHGDYSNAAKGTLTLDWRILEHNDGVKLQIIYVGGPDAEMVLSGALIGQPAPSKRILVRGGRAPAYVEAILTTMACFLLIVLSRIGREIAQRIQRGRRARRERPSFLSYGIAGALFLCLMVIVLQLLYQAIYYNYFVVPPFGF